MFEIQQGGPRRGLGIGLGQMGQNSLHVGLQRRGLEQIILIHVLGNGIGELIDHGIVLGTSTAFTTVTSTARTGTARTPAAVGTLRFLLLWMVTIRIG